MAHAIRSLSSSSSKSSMAAAAVAISASSRQRIRTSSFSCGSLHTSSFLPSKTQTKGSKSIQGRISSPSLIFSLDESLPSFPKRSTSISSSVSKNDAVAADEEQRRRQSEGDHFPSRISGIFCGAIAVASAYLFLKFFSRPLRAAELIDGGGVPSGPRTASRRSTYNFIADVVQDVAAALVYIEIKDLGVRDYFTGQPVTSSNGSGFVVRSDGLILTNAHVVINKPNASVQVRLQDGRTFTGIVEDVDVKSDLATVRIPCKDLLVMPLGTSSNVRPGEFVIAMGSPLSLSNTITTGVVSTASRQRAELGLRDRDVPEYIQTDAAITFGNSGGPLVNLDGEAIGINSMKVTPGISFAIPIDYAKEFLKKSDEARAAGIKLRKAGDRRYMGVTMLTINSQIIEELKARLQMPATVLHGIVIFRIVRGSPADVAGLLPGDIVTHINGVPIHGSRDVYKLLEGDEDLKMKAVRKDQYLNVTVRPEPAE